MSAQNVASEPVVRGPRINRPPASASWEFQHRWGLALGDTTNCWVNRTADGSLRIHDGKATTEFSRDVVDAVASAVAAAAAWTDEGATR